MSESYRIAYIDEVLDDRETFSYEVSKEGINIYPIDPLPDLEAMINYLLDENFDAIVVDYTLYASRPDIKYSGVELIEEFWKNRLDFPAFIMTNNRDADNVDDKIRSTLVFQKKSLNSEPSEIIRKLKKEVKYYRSENQKLANEFDILNLKNQSNELTMTDSDFERLEELDSLIEKRISKQKSFSKLLKDSANNKKLNSVLDMAEQLFTNLKKE